MDNFYMLNQMDRWITGDYGEDRDDGWLDDIREEFLDFEEEEEDG